MIVAPISQCCWVVHHGWKMFVHKSSSCFCFCNGCYDNEEGATQQYHGIVRDGAANTVEKMGWLI